MFDRLKSYFAPNAKVDIEPAVPATRLGPGLKVYAIGDVHGEVALLERLADLIALDLQQNPPQGSAEIILLGDYLDRGSDARAVIERLSAGPLVAGTALTCLMGNHERVALDFLEDPVAHAAWLDFGGVETLLSYGVQPLRAKRDHDDLIALAEAFGAALPPHHRRFLNDLPLMVERGDYIFVHAGIDPKRALSDQRSRDMLWRRPAEGPMTIAGRCLVHGHDVVDDPTLTPDRIAVDTGAYATGRLTALVLEGTARAIIST